MADIVFVIAPIGGGKSWYSTRALCLELERSERNVVTNLPLYIETAPPGQMTLQEWCQKYVAKPVDVRKRVRVLDRDEVFEYWRYLPGRNIANVERPDATGKGEIVPDLQSRQSDPADFGTFYLIDEVHLYFSARSWGINGIKVETYMSQLRKLNDDLFLITQHPEKVDKNFRRNATEWLYLKNMGRTRLWGGVSLPGRFRFERFDAMPTRGDKPLEAGGMHLKDKEFHKVYDTMSGVGLTGKLNPESSRIQGGHWSRWVAIGACTLLVAFMLPRIFGYVFSHATGAMVASTAKGMDSMLPHTKTGEFGYTTIPTKTEGAKNVASYPSAPASFQSGGKPATVSEPEVSMSGYAKIGGVWCVCLSDGRILRSDDAGFEKLMPNSVRYEGKVYRRALAAPQSSAGPSTVPRSPSPAVDAGVSQPSPERQREINVHFADGTVIHNRLSVGSPQTGDGQ